MKKLFFDMEFTGLHQNTTSISIGIIAESGETFYAEFTDYDREQVDKWIEENVIKKLKFNLYPESESIINGSQNNYEMKSNRISVRERLTEWIAGFGGVEMWSDCLAYDWMLFCQLWGGALSVPKNIYYIPLDICTMFREKNIHIDINREHYAFYTVFPNTTKPDVIPEKHNALWDAKVIRLCYQRLLNE